MPPTRGKIMIQMYDYRACMDYMNLDVCLQIKAVELNHSLTGKYKDIITEMAQVIEILAHGGKGFFYLA